MKKSFISFLLIICLVFSCNIIVFGTDYNAFEFDISEIDKYNIVSAEINGKNIHFTVLNYNNSDTCKIVIGDYTKTVDGRKKYFDVDLNLDGLSNGEYSTSIFIGNKSDEYIYDNLQREIIIVSQNGELYFKKYSFYENNKSISNNKPGNALSVVPYSTKIKTLSDNIVSGCNTNEDKVARIYKWMNENIAYDNVNLYKGTTSYMIPDFVVENKRAVCIGKAYTLQALLAAQGIPCLVYTGVLYNDDGTEIGGHAWNEVYLSGKWYMMDTTADTYNYYENSGLVKRLQVPLDYFYFCLDLNSAALEYKYDDLDEKSEILRNGYQNINCSNWAVGEIANSGYSGIYHFNMQGDYTRPITRGEFCDLLYDYLVEQLFDDYTFNYNVDQASNFLYQGNTYFYHSFHSEADLINSSIFACYVNGIVEGKSKTYFGVNDLITREEAATMLARTLELLSSKSPTINRSYNTSKRFADDWKVSSWAKDKVSIISDMGIMNGVGNNEFDPKGYYTVEQTIATLNRMYNYNYRR